MRVTMKTLKSNILTLLAIGAGLTSSQVQGQVTLFEDAFTTVLPPFGAGYRRSW